MTSSSAIDLNTSTSSNGTSSDALINYQTGPTPMASNFPAAKLHDAILLCHTLLQLVHGDVYCQSQPASTPRYHCNEQLSLGHHKVSRKRLQVVGNHAICAISCNVPNATFNSCSRHFVEFCSQTRCLSGRRHYRCRRQFVVEWYWTPSGSCLMCYDTTS